MLQFFSSLVFILKEKQILYEVFHQKGYKLSGPILESQGMGAIFYKKAKNAKKGLKG